MDYKSIINGIKKYGSTERDICVGGLGIQPEQVRENVIIAPWWEPPLLPLLGTAKAYETGLSKKVWEIDNGGRKFTYIKTGIGAGNVMDMVLLLGVTPCKNIIFIGSVGALDERMEIGDIVIPEYSVCGDGACKYLLSENLATCSGFGKKFFPDGRLSERVLAVSKDICAKNNVALHAGKNFSVDTILAQFVHLEEILKLGCNCIEMETAAAFAAAATAKLAIAAVFSVSDNTLKRKSLISGRTDAEQEYRKFVRGNIIPQIILNCFKT